MEESKPIMSKRTAILVIHGIGEQMPLETLDSFGKGLVDELRQVIDTSKKTSLHHLIKECKDSNNIGFDNYIRIRQESTEGYIDVHEYYWAYLTERKINLDEIDAWIDTTLEGSKDFFDENKKLLKKYEGKEYKDHKDYSEKLTGLLKYGVWGYRLLRFFSNFLGQFYWFQYIVRIFQNKVSKLMVGYVGDIAIYTTTDAKSKNFNIRQQILSGAVNKLISLLQSDDYEQIILAGHSLGSVISYDALNKLNLIANYDLNIRKMAQDKIKAFITFGSPLDKIAFFFRDRAKKDAYIRRQILSHLHSFKARELDLTKYTEDEKVQNPIEKNMEHISWLNFFHENDPVSGHLDFYKDVQNVPCDFENEKDNRWGIAHLGYWQYAPMFNQVIEKIFESNGHKGI